MTIDRDEIIKNAKDLLGNSQLLIVDNLTTEQESKIEGIINSNKDSEIHYWIAIKKDILSQKIWMYIIIMLSEFFSDIAQTKSENDLINNMKDLLNIGLKLPAFYELKKLHEENCDICNPKGGKHVH